MENQQQRTEQKRRHDCAAPPPPTHSGGRLTIFTHEGLTLFPRGQRATGTPERGNGPPNKFSIGRFDVARDGVSRHALTKK